MKSKPALRILFFLPALLCLAAGNAFGDQPQPNPELAQVPAWSHRDMDFFLHGSMSTEAVPEPVLRAFIQIYPDLFPSQDLSHLGLIPDPAFGWPVGFSRSRVEHLGNLPSVGVNCAACHVGEISSAPGAARVRVLGMTSHFDSERFFGSVTVAMLRTADPANMKRFLAAYLSLTDRAGGDASQKLLLAEWQRQEQKITAAIAADPAGSHGIAPGAFQKIAGNSLRLDHQLLARGMDLSALANSMLKLFHNIRASLHIPDHLPNKLPPPSGPGRNDFFGALSTALFDTPQPYAPVKYGLVWNLNERRWADWDGNTQSHVGRNLLAALGLGAPLVGQEAYLDFTLIKNQTRLSGGIHAPAYPFAIDEIAAKRGAVQYQAHCASCHDGPEIDRRLHPPSEVGTDPLRARLFSQSQADLFNDFLAGLRIPGYEPPKEKGVRSTQKYWAPSLAGVWARSPYLHNGSVRTMQDLLTRPADRAKQFKHGSRIYDQDMMGYIDDGDYLLATTTPGNANIGHDYATGLPKIQKRELMEYLKTL
jgi:hypothetical protein